MNCDSSSKASDGDRGGKHKEIIQLSMNLQYIHARLVTFSASTLVKLYRRETLPDAYKLLKRKLCPCLADWALCFGSCMDLSVAEAGLKRWIAETPAR